MRLLIYLSSAIVPAMLALCGFLILRSKKPLFDSFIAGAKRGFECAVGLFPTLCVLICAVSMLSACGFTECLSGVLSQLGIPDGLAPFLITRPISGAASSAALCEIFETVGVDSRAGIAASIIMSSSDTMIYVISVYCSGAGIKHARAALPAATLAMLAVNAAAIFAAGFFRT